MGDTPPRTVDRTSQAERAWVDDEAQRRRERWEKRKPQLDADRRLARAQMPALELHQHALERAVTLSTVSATPVGRSSPNSERQQPGPPTQQQPDDDPRWREAWEVIRRRLEDAHRLLDEYEGLGATAAATMTGSEKDRLILTDGRGRSCQAVVDTLGREVAGSARTVFRVRKATQDPSSEQARMVEGPVSTVDGEPVTDSPPKLAVRRVRIG